MATVESQTDLHAALAGIARAIADSLEVRDVWDRVADACRTLVPFDAMGIVRLLEDGSVQAVAAAGEAEPKGLVGRIFPRSGYSPAFWPDEERFVVLMRDTAQHLDPAYMLDKLALERGYRSALRVPLGHGRQRLGSVLLVSHAPDAFDESHASALLVIAELASLALAHQGLAETLAEETSRSAEARARAEHLERRVQALAEELESRSPHRALGQSARWRDVLTLAAKVAPTDTTVLLSGESGTGKEVIARFIHRGSARRDGPFIALNCAALPEQLLESELFGHERGAFTGAVATRTGKLEQAAGGVLFLDEVAEMSPTVQAKFLRVLQEREFQRLGGTRTLHADVRVLAATHRNLPQAIERGTFREDLFYRLAVFDLPLPSLRERREDIPLLIDAFLEESGRNVGRPAAGIDDAALASLVAHDWPGNVRELRNAIERAVILCEGGLVTAAHLPMGIGAAANGAARDRQATVHFDASRAQSLGDAERALIVDALARAGQNKSQAARLLGITRAQLRSRIERHRL
ncbi:sigma 54-interacting transcriptional regulator [Lysobacter sp. KIS68-7]|uniref:sigma-54-dependent Fis family transcriptional regulator n=1 Tax=Lysobacter sp. KIS68-7 TaxID=2904252 RepID=UPI001E45C1E6|nr:sigma 54-interacting transcriptional regulator [Lysobacter sp. KIS68-7]UHQ19166.1 sigma 54-interacting transcriptional regulator [Lysobacter sp. KIS68-7]